ELGLLGGKENGDSTIKLFSQMDAASVILGAGLTLESKDMERGNDDAEKRECAEPGFHKGSLLFGLRGGDRRCGYRL
ncbi:MAG: hypothetical protein WBX22_16155, partial [Silvibacterium sp.]